MKKYIFVLLAIAFIVNSSHAQPGFTFTCGTTGGEAEGEPENQLLMQNCNNSFTNFLAQHADDLVPQNINGTLKIRTNVIFVQNENGDGNFQISNSAHMAFWESVFSNLNQRMENLLEESCSCTTPPQHYSNIHIEFVPNYIEVRDNFAWDHRNDPQPSTKNSFNKPYLNYINTLASQSPGYQDGFNAIITTDGPGYNEYVYNNPANLPLWELNYQSYYQGNWYSSFPVFNLAHPAMWHAPDLYLWYINGVDHLGGQWWLDTDWIPFTAGGFLHEYGHYFNLTHKYQCPNNVMGAPTRTSFSGCQVREMYMTLMTKNLRKYVICEDKLEGYNLSVDSDETWRLNMRVFGDVIVRSGARLTITCELHMSPKGRIIVERGGTLVVDGGLITGDCANSWKGIIVEGDVPGQQAASGKVILQNQAIIENARDAISMYPIHRPWDNGDLHNYFGGIVEADNATIRNCGRGVEFMKYGYGGIKDKSFFNNVTFTNIHDAVTIWADDGVTFDNCTFSKIVKKGIYAYDCEVIVREANTFETQPIGVDIITTYPIIFSSKIGEKSVPSNRFLCQKAGVNIQSASNVEPLTIFNNIFEGGNNGVKHNGNGLLYIEKNRLKNHLTAVEIHGAGINFNHVKNNEIQSSFLGAHSVNTNTGLRYLDNCFSGNSLVDIFVSAGDIFPYQGSMSKGAGNCFTKNNVPEVDNDAGSGQVFYYVKTGTPTNSCKYPVNSNNINIENALSENAANCGPDGFVSDDPDDYCVYDGNSSIEQLKQIRTTLLQEKTELIGSTDAYAIKQTDRCIEWIEALIGRKMLEPGSQDLLAGKEAAIAFFNSEGMDFKDKTNSYGIMVSFGELQRAKTFLNNLAPESSWESNFINVQNINLEYLANPESFQLPDEQKNDLYQIGTDENDPYNGYARSLYEVLTGDRIEVFIPEYVGERSKNESTKAFDNNGMFQIYPNPVSDGMVYVQVYPGMQAQVEGIVITDAYGKNVVKTISGVSGVIPVDISGLHSGVYFVALTGPGNSTVASKKLVVLK